MQTCFISITTYSKLITYIYLVRGIYFLESDPILLFFSKIILLLFSASREYLCKDLDKKLRLLNLLIRYPCSTLLYNSMFKCMIKISNITTINCFFETRTPQWVDNLLIKFLHYRDRQSFILCVWQLLQQRQLLLLREFCILIFPLMRFINMYVECYYLTFVREKCSLFWVYVCAYIYLTFTYIH